MIMLLLKDVPTLQSMATDNWAMGNWTRVENIFSTANTESLVVMCNTDPRLWGPGTDHVPVLTTLEYALPVTDAEQRRNFRKVDWDKFHKELAEQLCDIPGPCTLLTDLHFQKAIKDLTRAI